MDSNNLSVKNVNDTVPFPLSNDIATSICKYLKLKEIMAVLSVVSKEWYKASSQVNMWQNFCHNAKVTYSFTCSPRDAFLKAHESKDTSVIQTCIKIFSQNILIPLQINRVHGYIDFLLHSEVANLPLSTTAQLKLKKAHLQMFIPSKNSTDEECYKLLCEVSNDDNALEVEKFDAQFLKVKMVFSRRSNKLTFEQADQLLQEFILDPKTPNRLNADAKCLMVEMFYSDLTHSLNNDEADKLLLSVLQEPKASEKSKITSNLLRALFRCYKNVNTLTDDAADQLLIAILNNPFTSQEHLNIARLARSFLRLEFRIATLSDEEAFLNLQKVSKDTTCSIELVSTSNLFMAKLRCQKRTNQLTDKEAVQLLLNNTVRLLKPQVEVVLADMRCQLRTEEITDNEANMYLMCAFMDPHLPVSAKLECLLIEADFCYQQRSSDETKVEKSLIAISRSTIKNSLVGIKAMLLLAKFCYQQRTKITMDIKADQLLKGVSQSQPKGSLLGIEANLLRARMHCEGRLSVLTPNEVDDLLLSVIHNPNTPYSMKIDALDLQRYLNPDYSAFDED